MSKTLDLLSKIIAQADNASTEAEREAYMEKAQDMSAQIGVELSVARAHHASKRREMPVADHKVQINSWSAKPIHRQAMMDLFLAIARAQDVKCLIGGGNYTVFCYGLPSDIELCEKLYVALSLQMVREADAAIKRGDQKIIYMDGRVYRRYFYEGFTNRVSGRLHQARQEAIDRLDEQATRAGVTEANTGIVLRDKRAEITEFFDEKIKHMKLGRTYQDLGQTNDKLGHADYGATRHGSQAADRANLGTSDRDLPEAGHRALT